MSENALWITVRSRLTSFLEMERVENRVAAGTPDIWWCARPPLDPASGWIELKYLDRWPVRSHTPVVLPKLTLSQVLFAERAARCHVSSIMLLKVDGPDGGYGLWDAEAMRAVFEREMTRADMMRRALAWFDAAIPFGAFLRALTCHAAREDGSPARESALS